MNRPVNSAARPLEETLAQLVSEAGLPAATLAELSGLGSAGLAALRAAWPRMSAQRRRGIVRRLAEMSDADIRLDFKAIFKDRLQDPDPEVRRVAVGGLWECEEPSLVAPLVGMMEDESPDVRAEAARALGRLALLAEEGRMSAERAVLMTRSLLKTLADPAQPFPVRCRSLEALAPLSVPGIARAILAAHRSDHEALSLSALTAMGRSCDSSWVPVLASELGNRNADRRRKAAEALGEIEDDEAVPDLAELIYDEDTAVRLATIRALGAIGGGEARETLEQCLDDTSEAICQAAEEALARASPDEDLDPQA